MPAATRATAVAREAPTSNAVRANSAVAAFGLSTWYWPYLTNCSYVGAGARKFNRLVTRREAALVVVAGVLRGVRLGCPVDAVAAGRLVLVGVVVVQRVGAVLRVVVERVARVLEVLVDARLRDRDVPLPDDPLEPRIDGLLVLGERRRVSFVMIATRFAHISARTSLRAQPRTAL